VRQLYEMYASGLQTDRTLAAWLNVNEQQTSRDRAFSADTVREMLRNSAYAGYVSARRDTSKAIRGQHQAIVEEPLFDRVQAMRGERARTMNPGRPSQRYLLKGLARCERCQGKMQGPAVGRKLAARYYCATRRNAHSCDQPLIHADRVEAQLVEFIADFKPHPAIRNEILRRLTGLSHTDTTQTTAQRAALEERLHRARDLYEIGDLTRPEYIARRDAINNELATHTTDPIPDLDQAQRVLEDFTIFWRGEQNPAAKRQLLSLIFERVWLDEQKVVAVRPKPSFVPYFQNPPLESAANGVRKERERRDSNPRPPT
jgi:Recombinase/Recombinase zinc beta ribbon domain